MRIQWYITKKRLELQLHSNHPALVLFDRFKGQCTKIFHLLETNNIMVTVVPALCTDRLQPLDVSVNKSIQEFLCGQFHEWYSDVISQQLKSDDGSTSQPVDLRMSVVKPVGAKWLIKAYDYMKSNGNIVRNGFRLVVESQ